MAKRGNKRMQRMYPSRGLKYGKAPPDETEEDEEPESLPLPEARAHMQTWSPDLSDMFVGGEGDDDGVENRSEEMSPEEADALEDSDAIAFWKEQRSNTPGKGNRPRLRDPEPLPDPMPSLAPPEQKKGRLPDNVDNFDEEMPVSFRVAYQRDKIKILDTEGEQMDVPSMPTLLDAVEQLALPKFLQASMAKRKFHYLTPVQECTMPLMKANKDFLASAVTGSGKTAAYMVPILSSLHQVSRLRPGDLVASHYKLRNGARSSKPILGKMRGLHGGFAAVEFELATDKVHRQLIEPEWVVGAPELPPRPPLRGPATPSAVVLVPTRELSEQVHLEAQKFTRYSNLRSVALFGGISVRSQLRELAHGADILVATPGRLIDALHLGVLKLERVKHLVLDEVDRMMEAGFGDQLEEIMEQGGMPGSRAGRQTTFWSATIPQSVRDLVEEFIKKAIIWVDCTGGVANPMSSTIEHVLVDARPRYPSLRKFEPGQEVITKGGRRGVVEFLQGRKWRVMFSDRDMIQHQMVMKGRIHPTSTKTLSVQLDRLALLSQVLKSEDLESARVIVFCRKRETAMEVYRYLRTKFEGVVVCHGGMTEHFRSKNVQALRDGKADVLVATDIAARGLDIQNITHVINYELPLVIDEFVHRCGRTGRIGNKGMAVTFITGRENIFNAIRRTIKAQQGIPEWFNLQRMQAGWRHRYTKIPFKKGKEPGLSAKTSPAEIMEYAQQKRASYEEKRRAAWKIAEYRASGQEAKDRKQQFASLSPQEQEVKERSRSLRKKQDSIMQEMYEDVVYE